MGWCFDVEMGYYFLLTTNALSDTKYGLLKNRLRVIEPWRLTKGGHEFQDRPVMVSFVLLKIITFGTSNASVKTRFHLKKRGVF